jgi:hypothetical protein
MYNHSLRSADRATHLKIVLVPLVAGVLLALAAVNLRATADAHLQANAALNHHSTLLASSASAVIR